MMPPGIDRHAQLIVERVVNSLPEGILIALGASLLLRLLRRQNSGTRFAVWLIALAAVVALPFLRFSAPAEFVLPIHHFAVTLSPFWASAFLLLWTPLAALALFRLVLGLWRIRQIRSHATEICSASLDPQLRALFDECPVSIRLLVSDQMTTPSAIGFRKPAVVLPTWILSDFSPAELRPILIHELAHLRRRDSWTNLFQKAVRALFFFHPAVWWIDARLSIEREMACDDAVLAATIAPDAYAGSLIGLLEKSCAQRGWTMAQAAVSRAREASQRIARILSARGPATTRIGLPTLGLAAAVFAACGGLALTAPRMLTFAPPVESAAALLPPQPLENKSTAAPSSGIVLTAYHPKPLAATVRHRAVRRAAAPSHRPALHIATLHAARKTSRNTAPYVMINFIASGLTEQTLTPALLVINTPDATYVQPVFEISAPVAAEASHRASPDIRIQTLRYTRQTPTGFSAGYINILITLPARSAPAVRPLAT